VDKNNDVVVVFSGGEREKDVEEKHKGVADLPVDACLLLILLLWD
jgi:hypothetical protein